MQMDTHTRTCTHITLVSYSVLTVTSRLETVRKEKELDMKKRGGGGCAKLLCHQVSKTEDNQEKKPTKL